MYFQPLDYKDRCFGVYSDGKLNNFFDQDKLKRTWSYSSFLRDHDHVEYGIVRAKGLSLYHACPGHLKDDCKAILNKKAAFERSFEQAKMDISKLCWIDCVPEYFIYEYSDLLCEITKHVFDNYEKSDDYEHLSLVYKFITEIEHRPLRIKWSNVRNVEGWEEFVTKNISKNKICYDMFKTITGRLSTTSESFPILNFNSKFRSAIEPHNDVFVELDFNAAELRVLLGLNEVEQPQEDLHEYLIRTYYDNDLKKEEFKSIIFGWLYNPHVKHSKLDEIFQSEYLLEKYYDGSHVSTPFGRKIKSDNFHALNYLLQSTSSDLLLKKAVQIAKMLEDSDSYIAWTMHDSIILDMSKKDLDRIGSIRNTLEKTQLGDFVVNVSVGNNYGNMAKV